MKHLFIFATLHLLSTVSFAQTDSLPVPIAESKLEKIASSRRELLHTFLLDDPAGAGLWVDSLARLEDDTCVGLVWDERWLLYYWTESYGTLLEELSQFDETQQSIQSWKRQPTPDSLFEWVDFTINERRFDIFSSIQTAFLNVEEKAFTVLLLDYLLRLNKDEAEWADRLQSFENHYPTSRFLAFARSIKPSIPQPTNKAFGISLGFMVGNFRDKIERTLHTPYMFNLDFYYWKKRWNFLFDFSVGSPNLARDLFVGGDAWPKDETANFYTLGLGLGYDIVNSRKVRIFPSLGAGVGFLNPPSPDESEEPLPAYYANFEFREFHLAAALTTDLKLFPKNHQNWRHPKGSYHGIRLKFGWDGLNFGKKNPSLQGDMFYFSVGYNLFSVVTKKS